MSLASSVIDRLAPMRRPSRRPVQYQRWRKLLFAHWRLPAVEVARLLPAGLTLDTWEDDAWIGLVPFEMHVRPRWSPWGLAFAETNVRTYVHFQGRDPGVWFFSLEASSSLAVGVARWRWHLNYFRATMEVRRSGDRVRYTSRRLWPGASGASLAIEAEIGALYPGTDAGHALPGTLEHFLVERYLLYSCGRSGRLFRGQVHHRPYPLRSAQIPHLTESLFSANGIVAGNDPCHVLFSDGVDVEIFPLVPVEPAAC